MPWYQLLLFAISFFLIFFILFLKYDKQISNFADKFLEKFVLRPIVIPIVIIGMAGIIIWSNHLQKKSVESFDSFSSRMNHVVQTAEQIKDSCEVIPFNDRHLVGKVLIHLNDFSGYAKENMLFNKRTSNDELGEIKPEDIKTVVLIEKIDDDWGNASGTVILLDQEKKFRFSVSSGIEKKKLGSSVHAYPYVVNYLESLSMKSN